MASISFWKLFCLLKYSIGRLGLLLSGRADPRGGNSMAGEWASRGDTENRLPLSEISEGAPSKDSALEASETEGDGSGASLR